MSFWQRRFFALFVGFMLATVSHAAQLTLAWDNAQPLEGQTITGTEILIDGLVVGESQGESFTVDLSDYALQPGDQITFTARHVGTINQVPARSGESEPLVYTMSEALAAPTLRIQIIID